MGAVVAYVYFVGATANWNCGGFQRAKLWRIMYIISPPCDCFLCWAA